MECPRCGKWAPPDRESGYDVDELCPPCKEIDDMSDNKPPQAPPGWNRIVDNVGRGGGLIYLYPKGILPNGETEFHLTKEALHAYVFPNRP